MSIFSSYVHGQNVIFVSVILLEPEHPVLQGVKPRIPEALELSDFPQGPKDLLQEIDQAELLDHFEQGLNIGWGNLQDDINAERGRKNGKVQY